jgi:hypothetical protein
MSEPFESWAIVELMGHVRMAGKVSQVEMLGAVLGRIDIPQGDGFVTQFFGGGSVYRLTPCGEAEARAVAAANTPQPVHHWEMAKLPGAPARDQDDEWDDDDADHEPPF